MIIVITGSSGHLGEAPVRTLVEDGHDAVGIDVKHSPFTERLGSIADPGFVRKCLHGVDIVLHTATLHKPHVATHARQEFVDTNISGTLNLLEESVRNQVQAFVYTSTTSTFGDAMRPAKGGPAVWVTEDLKPEPKNLWSDQDSGRRFVPAV
jgi:UDP-glucose 4-epimerase